MQTLLAEKNYEAIGNLLNKEQGEYISLQRSHYCDNVPINSVVCFYCDTAKRNQIQIQIALSIPVNIQVNEWELAVVVGNLMENAVQAAARVPDPARRVLRVSAKSVREQLLIEIQNNYEGNIIFDKNTMLPLSSEEEGHGIGLYSVCCFAQRNQGFFDCGVEDGEFFARLLV